MRELKELVFFIEKYHGKKVTLAREKQNSKLQQFYEGILQGIWEDDQSAMEALYGTEREASSAYRKLKMTLKNKLIELVFSIDLKNSDATDRQKAAYACYKDWAATKLFLTKNVRLNAIELGTKVLKDAIKNEFSDLCRDAAAALRLQYGTIEGNERKFHYYNNLYKKYSYLCQREELAEEYFSYLTMQYVNVRKIEASLHENAKAYYQELEADLNRYKSSYRLHLFGRLIQMTIYRSINDYEGTIEVCKSAVVFFKQKAYFANAPLQIFYYEMLESYMALKKFDESIQIAKELNKYIEVGVFNWFKYKELYFLLSTHTGNYEEALSVFQEVRSNPKFQFLPPHVIETWKIFEAYLFFLMQTKVLDREEQIAANFRLGKFLNEISIFSKDKGGMNVPVLIIQLLLSILDKEHGGAAEQIEAINKYCSRYLNEVDNQRNFYFIKMLLKIPQYFFHYQTILEKTNTLWDKLCSISLKTSQQSLETEIIPYEKLWEFVLGMLNNKAAAASHSYQ